jgi:hypothetical protein
MIQNKSFYSIGSPELSKIASHFFPNNCAVHFRGVVYDQYSIDELGQTGPGVQWLTLPLPNELGRANYPKPWQPPFLKTSNFLVHISPETKSTLAFVKQIYVITDQSFTDRHEHLKRVFLRHDIPIESIKWQFKWNRTTCKSDENRDEVRERLNLKPGKCSKYRTIYSIFQWEHIKVTIDSFIRYDHILRIVDPYIFNYHDLASQAIL